jgi:hypothetical protein
MDLNMDSTPEMQMQAAMMLHASLEARFINTPDYIDAIHQVGEDAEARQEIYNYCLQEAIAEAVAEAAAIEAEVDAHFEAANYAAVEHDPEFVAMIAEEEETTEQMAAGEHLIVEEDEQPIDDEVD